MSTILHHHLPPRTKTRTNFSHFLLNHKNNIFLFTAVLFYRSPRAHNQWHCRVANLDCGNCQRPGHTLPPWPASARVWQNFIFIQFPSGPSVLFLPASLPPLHNGTKHQKRNNGHFIFLAWTLNFLDYKETIIQPLFTFLFNQLNIPLLPVLHTVWKKFSSVQ